MIKYVWIIILVLAHIIAFIYIAQDFRVTYKHCVMEKTLSIGEFIDKLDDNTKSIIVVLAAIWFIVSLFIFLVSLFAKYQL